MKGIAGSSIEERFHVINIQIIRYKVKVIK
jgi:hypothetical protein